MRKKILVMLLFIGLLFIILGFTLSKSEVKDDSSKSSSSQNAAVTGFPSAGNSSVKGEKTSIQGQRTVFVASVLDGDTIQTETGEKIRYLGINAPEIGQPFANEATEENKKLVLGKSVYLQFDIETKDRYGRTLAYVYQGSMFINLEMIKQGLAVSETIQPNAAHQDEIVKAQKEARNACVGLWKGLCSNTTDQVANASASTCIKITKINADAPGNDNTNKNGEWIEIKNDCNQEVSLSSWLLKDTSASNKYQFKNFSFDANQTVHLHSGCGSDTQAELYWQCPEGKYAIWNNAGDHAFLYNSSGELVSDYQY